MLFRGYISRMRISIASEDKRTIGNSGNEPKSIEAVEDVGEKRCELLTETHGLEVALGVGDRCTVTNAIQAPVNGYLKETGGGETDIIVSGDISHCSSVATVALPLCDCSAHAPEPPAVKIQWPQAMVNCVCTEEACEIMS